MKLYTLLRGRAKDRLKPVMIDSLPKVENYRKSLVASDPGSGKTWHYNVQAAPVGSSPWRKNNSGPWTNYDSPNPPLVKNGSRT